jgi:hypothetical protein
METRFFPPSSLTMVFVPYYPKCRRPVAIEFIGLVINIRWFSAGRRGDQLDHGEIEDKKKKKWVGEQKKGHAKGRSGQEAIKD